MLHHQAKQVIETIVKFVEEAFDWAVELGEEFTLHWLQTEQLATKHWGERKCSSGRDHHHNAHHPTQLTEEHTGHTGHECQWEEHRNQGECRSYY